MVAAEYLFWSLGALLIYIISYLYFLAALSLMPSSKGNHSPKPETKFVILIPAYNEARVIEIPLKSIKNLNYPKTLYETIVIADNCTDETAKIVTDNGVRCLKRNDREKKGKGFALQWAFEYLKKKKAFHMYDAFVIIDADTIVDPNFLKEMDKKIAGKEKAIQGYYDVINPSASPMASLTYLGFVLSRNLRYKGKTRLNWSANLLGNGMCFSREVIDRFGWNATSIAEDVEYAIMLHFNGIRVSFAPEAKIFAEIPMTFKDARSQRSRWDIGKFQVRNRYLGRLVKKAIKTRDISYLDTAMELLIPPFSFFLILSFSLFFLFMVTAFTGFNGLFILWLIIISALIVYVMIGLAIAKANWRIYKNLFYAPFFLLWRVETVIRAYISKNTKKWIKTERKEDSK